MIFRLISIILLISLSASALRAQEKPAAAPVVTAEQHAQATNRILDVLDAYNALLLSVKDQSTVEAAKVKLAALTKEMATATAAASALGNVTPEIEKAYSKDPKNLERASKIHKGMLVANTQITADKAIFALLQPSLIAFQKTMRRQAVPASPPATPAPVK
jgi:hypothetical protein